MTNMQPISAEEEAEIRALVGDVGRQQMVALDTPVPGRGSYDAASRLDKQIAGWIPPVQSADLDMLPSKGLIDARARDLTRNDAYVQGGMVVHKDSIVGAFYMLNAKPNWKLLGLTEDWAEAFQEEVEAKFTLWAESPRKEVDAARQNDFTGLIRLAVGVYCMSGEALATVEWPKQKGREYRTALQMIDTDRLSNPDSAQYRSDVRGGIKLDAYGAPISAFIRVGSDSDWMFGSFEYRRFWKEVPWTKPWGRAQVVYLREQMRVDQTRAVADIAAGLREIAITRKFRDVTLQKAILAATYAATIESELPAEVVYKQLGVGDEGGVAEAVVDYSTTFLQALNSYAGGAKNLLIDGAKIPHLFPGTKLNFQSSSTPSGVGQEFEQSLLRYVAVALGISYEELSRDYTKTNYSSARAAMNNTWKFMQSRKRVVADAFANAIYRLWLEEAIQRGSIESFTPAMADRLYTDGTQNTLFDALCSADWIGAARGQIDELKETQAAVLRIKYGLSTHEDELARLGKDWRKTYAQLERERIEREARGIVLQEDNSVNAASGTVREDENDGTGSAEQDAE
jgi:lambda family phage portal protein